MKIAYTASSMQLNPLVGQVLVVMLGRDDKSTQALDIVTAIALSKILED